MIKKRHYFHTVKNASEAQEVDLKVVKYLIDKGDHVIDVGANIGVYTKALSELVGKHGKVTSFEPIPPTFEILANNVKRCRLQNVQLINCALTDHNAELKMEVPQYECGGENYYEAKIIGEQDDSQFKIFKIQGRTMDSVITAHATTIKFIKCDVEGNELPVVKSAKEIIQRDHPAFLIEVGSDPDVSGTNAFELFQLMGSYGYEPYLFKDNILKKRAPGNRSVNYFFFQKDHLSKIQNQIRHTQQLVKSQISCKFDHERA